MSKPIPIQLTQAEIKALLASNRHTEAGAVGEILTHGRAVNAFERADRKLREALHSARRTP